MCCPAIDDCFERVFSLALGLGPNCVPLQNILTSEDYRRILYLLSPAERRRLKNAIQLEYYHIERTLTRARCDVAALRTGYELAICLMHLAPPIHRLPVELLMLIFFFMLDEKKPDIGSLIGTCQKWKEIVSSMLAPLKLATWTSVDAVNDILGKNASLIVTIDPASDDTMDHPIDPETKRYRALMLAASTSVSRWRTLDILSLPDLQQTGGLFEKQSHATIGPVPMNYLRSLKIPILHDNSPFLDLLLPSIGATASVQLTEMHLCSAQAMLYLAQPHCVQVFNHLTSFKCSLPRTDSVIDILPRFLQLEILEVSGVRFSDHHPDVELPLTKTLRQMSLRVVPIAWMNHREFLRLESCTIYSPLESDTMPVASLPICTKLHFEGPRFDAIKKFHVPTPCALTLHSPQWSKSRGNDQLSHLWGAVPSAGGLRPTSLHLSLTCSSEQLLRALCFMPELKELILELDRPTALGRCFFVGLLPSSSRVIGPDERADKSAEPLQACPSLEVLGLEYRRWFRPEESNELPALVAMAHFGKRGPRLRIWVKKSMADEKIDFAQPSAAVLCSLDMLQILNGARPQTQVVKETIEAFETIINPLGIKLYHAETMHYFSPSIYSCLFQQLRDFALYVDIDQAVLLEALAYFEHLEVMHVRRIGPHPSQSHLPLLRTLKRLELGITSLSWMDGCTFIKLEVLEINSIEGSGGELQGTQMPLCKSASFPRGISSDLLGAFKMPQLCNLSLHGRHEGMTGGLHYPFMQQFRLRTARFHFVNSVALQGALSMQPELETLEISGLTFRSQLGRGLPELLDILTELDKSNGFGNHEYSNHTMAPPRRGVLPCPKLKYLTLELQLGQEWEWEWEWKQEKKRELERKQQLAWSLEHVLGQVEEPEWMLERKRVRERVRVLELEVESKYLGGEHQRTSEVRQCQKFMKQRMEKGYPVQCCQLVWRSGQTEIASELVELPYLDMLDMSVPDLGDVFASFGLHGP